MKTLWLEINLKHDILSLLKGEKNDRKVYDKKVDCNVAGDCQLSALALLHQVLA